MSCDYLPWDCLPLKIGVRFSRNADRYLQAGMRNGALPGEVG